MTTTMKRCRSEHRNASRKKHADDEEAEKKQKLLFWYAISGAADVQELELID